MRRGGLRAAGERQASRVPGGLNRDLFAGSDAESESLARRNALEQERLRRAGQLTGDVPVATGRPDDLFSQSRRQIDVEDVTSADPYGGVSAGEVLASRSPTKSVEANKRRGRAAMTRVLLDKADVHRSMFRTGLGWVDFVWGDDGTYTGRRRMVEVIARGTEARRSEVERSVRAVLDDGEYEAVLTKAPGGNAWLLSGWRKLVGIGGGPAANDAKAPTRSTADSSDRRAGAIPARNTVPPATPGGQILASDPPPGSDDVEFQAGAAHVPMYQVAGSPVAPQTITIGRMAGDERTLEVPERPIRREQIMDAFQRAFQVRVYQGKPFKFRKALGFFRPRNHEMRIKAHNDLEVTAHEVWHWIDRTYPALRQLYHQPQFRDQLKGVSYDAKSLSEGFAEFGRLYMTNEPEAASRAPGFYQAFVQTARQLGIHDKLRRVLDDMHRWYAQGAELRAESKIGQDKPRLRDPLRDITDVDNVIAQSLDWLQAAKVIERETTGGIAEDATGSPYKTLRLLAGSRSTVEAFLNHGTLNWGPQGDLDFTGASLRQIFEPVSNRLDDAMDYFVGRRARELRRWGKERLFPRCSQRG